MFIKILYIMTKSAVCIISMYKISKYRNKYEYLGILFSLFFPIFICCIIEIFSDHKMRQIS